MLLSKEGERESKWWSQRRKRKKEIEIIYVNVIQDEDD